MHSICGVHPPPSYRNLIRSNEKLFLIKFQGYRFPKYCFSTGRFQLKQKLYPLVTRLKFGSAFLSSSWESKIASEIRNTKAQYFKETLAEVKVCSGLMELNCRSLLPILIRYCVNKRRAKTAGKTRNTTDF